MGRNSGKNISSYLKSVCGLVLNDAASSTKYLLTIWVVSILCWCCASSWNEAKFWIWLYSFEVPNFMKVLLKSNRKTKDLWKNQFPIDQQNFVLAVRYGFRTKMEKSNDLTLYKHIAESFSSLIIIGSYMEDSKMSLCRRCIAIWQVNVF